MRRANVAVHDVEAGILAEEEKGKRYAFTYADGYTGPPVSLSMPCSQRDYSFDRFPPAFDGLLPEGMLLDALLRRWKIDRDDLFSQLVAVGEDLVGAVTVKEIS
jgi:serine/threonine-protein kinase HipA